MAYVGPARRRQGVWCHEHWESVGYPLVSSSYNYLVRDVFVEGTLTETYKAETNVEREVSYIFEVPPEASVTSFSAQIGNTRVEAIVDEKAEADKKYQQAKSAGIDAWKLDKVNDEIFQISLGYVKPNTITTIRVTYVYVISSDTIDDSIRLTIPAGLAGRPGTGPASETTVPTAPAGTNAVSITVGIEARDGDHIFGLASLVHLATIMNGFSNDSYKHLKPVQMQQQSSQSKAYVEFTSNQFLHSHFVLVWTVARVDHARCAVEQLSPSIPGKPDTLALALTLVSNVQLNADEHEYIFLVDYSGSMAGARLQAANQVVRTMLDNLPKRNRSSFNIYNFNTSAWSVVSGGRSLGFDTNNVNAAVARLGTSATGGTNINTALTTVLSQRDASKHSCSIIVISDGLDWGVTAAMQTIQNNVRAAAAKTNFLRVFVMGIGDDVSRGMCEALARAGSGATAYISESSVANRDHRDDKAKILVKSIGRAPIRVRRILWGVTAASTQGGGASGDNLDSRQDPDDDELGPAAKGDNLPPPPAIQQAPKPGTMFWAIRSYWFAIVHGDLSDLQATVEYEIPGSNLGIKRITIDLDFRADGRLIHTLAARALIQGFEDKAASITDATDRYWNEAEIVRLGKTYNLASTQTSFVATMNGVGTRTNVNSNAPPAGQSLLAAVPTNTSNLGFVNTQAPTASAGRPQPIGLSSRIVQSGATGLAAQAMRLALGDGRHVDLASAAASGSSAGGDELSELVGAQEGNGSFSSNIVERVAFPGTGIPEIPAFISSLDGRENVKNQIWLAICVIAYFTQKHPDRSSEWSEAESKARKFVEKTLCCIFGVDSTQSQNILTNSLNDAEGYFY